MVMVHRRDEREVGYSSDSSQATSVGDLGGVGGDER
jgi:hypothetical protein